LVSFILMNSLLKNSRFNSWIDTRESRSEERHNKTFGKFRYIAMQSSGMLNFDSLHFIH
jgi:hypothetical protein